MGPSGAGKTRLTFLAPSRALIGYQGEFLTDTRGSGVLNRMFAHYEPYKGAIEGRRNGVLVSNSDGEMSAYALWNLEDRGVMFVGAGEKTYQGMIIGENAKAEDLDVNPMKAKQLTNVRAAGKDEAIRLTPPRRPTLEQAIAYIERRRAGGGDPQGHPPAQAGAEPDVPEEAAAGRGVVEAGGLEPRTIVQSRGKVLSYLAGCIVAVAACVWFVHDVRQTTDLVVGWLGAVLFGAGIPAFAWQLWRPTRLCLDAEGLLFEGGPTRGTKRFLWRDIETFFVWEAGRGTKLVACRYLPGRGPGGAIQRMAYTLGADGTLATGWPMPADELVDLLNRYRSHASR